MGEVYTNLVNRIRARFNELTPQQKIAATYVLKRPDDVAILSMRGLAARATVQPVTFVRLARTLEFRGWEEFKAPFVDRMRGAPDLYSKRAARLLGLDPATRLMDEMHSAHLAAVDATRSVNTAQNFLAVADALNSARNVFIAGFRSCFGPAFALAYEYRLFRPEVVLLSSMGGTLEAELRAVGPEDVVVIIGFRPYSREAMTVAEHATRRGATLIAIADSPVAPFALGANIALHFETEGPSFFPSLVGAWALIEQLLSVMVARGGDAVVERLKSSEAQLHALGVFFGEDAVDVADTLQVTPANDDD